MENFDDRPKHCLIYIGSGEDVDLEMLKCKEQQREEEDDKPSHYCA